MSTPGAHFDELVSVMARLRAPDGCPWDRVQTHATLRPFLLEEAYETLEAIDRGASSDLCEELGDLLLQIVFHAQIAAEAGEFDVSAPIAAITRKLIRRHPHVFGDADRLTTAGAVVQKWEELKAAEGAASGTPQTLLGGVPQTLPALLRAYEYGTRAAAVGFDWARAGEVLDKIDEEVRELREAVAARAQAPTIPSAPSDDVVEEEMGDLLFAIANLSRKLGVEPENALRRADDKFRTRFTAVEQAVTARGERLQDKSLEELEAEWQRAKSSTATTVTNTNDTKG
jgi:tetrapyrrole methylase family protein/MazG family protein